jgi:hypothetical protein
MTDIPREGRRQIKRMGVPVTLTTKEQLSQGSHGSQWAASADSPHSIMAVPDPGGSTVEQDFSGMDDEADIVFMVRDDLSDTTDGELRDGGGEDASEIEYYDTTFRVEFISPYLAAGQVLLVCAEYSP